MLKFGVNFADLYTASGLARLNEKFIRYINKKNISYKLIDDKNLLKIATQIEYFLSELFDIEKEVDFLRQQSKKSTLLYECKRNFIQRYALINYPITKITEDLNTLESKLLPLTNNSITDELYAEKVMEWLKEPKFSHHVEIAAQYAVLKINKSPTALFSVPQKLDYRNLLQTKTLINTGTKQVESSKLVEREGFNLTDHGFSLQEAIYNSNYCIFCHTRGKDSCRKGMVNKEGKFLNSPLNVPLKGCPLKQKISEMNYLKAQHLDLAALAIITLDNPLCIATGHRICNDCERSCIYQAQEPVNVPGIETNILENILNLPYGFEIYSLLTRWNPLNVTSPFPKKNTRSKVLIVGLGPAGFTLAHYLLNEGHTVISIDGLKLEPLSPELTGRTNNLLINKFKPIKYIKEFFIDLDHRTINGFGGVMEYGITVRWNKNYLNIIRLLLERRTNFYAQGGVRLGSNITALNCQKIGFAHLAIAAGAGKPNLPSIKKFLERGVRTASDFLMSLQLGGAFKKDSLHNLQLRFPVVVLGGGLTAIDTATEALAYYPRQVLRFAERYYLLIQKYGLNLVESNWDTEEKIISKEFLEHANIIKELSEDKLQLINFLKQLGGVKIVYHAEVLKSPAYRLNHAEVQNALNEGIEFIEEAQVTEIITDLYNHVSGVTLVQSNKVTLLPAKSILVATGILENLQVLEDLKKIDPTEITILGDMNPLYRGSVVKAMASAKDCYQTISNKLLNAPNSKRKETAKKFINKIHKALSATIVAKNILSADMVELVIKSPLAARNFQPGQFFKLQNFSANAMIKEGVKLISEPIAVTGAKVQKKAGLITIIVFCKGTSTLFCKHLQVGELVSLMGPTGDPTEINSNENVLLIGKSIGNAALLSIGKAMRAKNCKVLYFAGYNTPDQVFKKDEVEKACNLTIWASRMGSISLTRKKDISFTGEILEALTAYHNDKLGSQRLPLKTIDRILIMGDNNLLEGFKQLLTTLLKFAFKENVKIIASNNSPMQCMMKGICAACLNKTNEEGKEGFNYSCCMQENDLSKIDFYISNQRLKQNSLEEKLSLLWARHLGA